MSNYERNFLHFAALHASAEVLNMLTAANSFGLDMLAEDRNGHSPKQCFLECHHAHFAVARKCFDEIRNFG